jgi:hypothetical protein
MGIEIHSPSMWLDQRKAKDGDCQVARPHDAPFDPSVTGVDVSWDGNPVLRGSSLFRVLSHR